MVRERFPQTALTHVDLKGAVNPVTETDTTAEALIIGRLREAFPEHRILGEETHGENWRAWDEPGPPMWLIDPLDGTVNFAHGFPYVGVSLALLAEGRPVVGVVYDPLRDETFAASAGSGTTRNSQPVHVSSVERLADGFLATGFPYNRPPPPTTTPGGWTTSCGAATGCAGPGRQCSIFLTSPAGGWMVSGRSDCIRGMWRPPA
jgi:myo-inositol-1(or 4)-monophosphatase